MTFTEHACGIAFPFESGGQRCFCERQAELIVRGRCGAGIELVAKALLIPSGSHSRTRGAADWAGNIAVGEADAGARDAVYMGGGDILAALHAELGVTEIVGYDEHDIWLSCRAEAAGDNHRSSRPEFQEIAPIYHK